jgi:DNA-damage-inducible protein D
MSELTPASSTFESIRQMDEDGHEFWYARELQPLLDYATWDKFKRVLEKAMMACSQSGQSVLDHFSQVGKMITVGKGAQREVLDYCLSRYACYLIVQNADPSKTIIAQGQTYFAIQTRRQELADQVDFQQLDENQKRIYLRNELRSHNKQLVEAAQQAGVMTDLDFAVFQNHGYQGLYGGMGAKAIHAHKGLQKNQKILDHMGSTELAANLFRATQTEDKLRRDNIQGKTQANQTHYEVGKTVRETIARLGGTMPEDLPTPSESINTLEQQQRQPNLILKKPKT